MSPIGLLTATEKQVHLGCLHATYTMAPQKQLEGSGVTRKGDSHSQVFVPTLTMVARQRQCSHRSAITPYKTCATNLYRRIKRRVGRSLKRAHCKGNLVPTRKQAAYKLPRTQSSFLSIKRVPRPLHKQDSSCSNRQYHSGSIYKQGRRYEIGSALRPSVEDLGLVYQKSSNPQSPTYPRPSKCGSGQAIQTRPDHPDRVVSSSRGLPSYMQQVTPASSGLVCHEVQQQVAPMCVTGTRSPGNSSGCTQSAMGGSGCLSLSTSSHLGQSGGEVAGHPMQENHFDLPGVAKYALVLGSGSHVQSNPTEPPLPAQPSNTALQSDPSKKSDKPKSPCLAPRAMQQSKNKVSLRQWQKGLRLLKGDPPNQSMRQSGPFLQSGAALIRWTSGHPLWTQWLISFCTYFRTGNYSPVPLMVTGRPLLTNWEIHPSISARMKTSLVSWIVSIETDPKVGGEFPPGTSLVIHQLTKAPFEPIKEASLKHLTFKTVFLLALGSGKRRSELHAWLNRNQLDWSKVSLYPSPSFLSKNQLAKEGPDSVAPVVIPALAPTLDRSLKSDRSLCPVRALRYYLDRTSDLQQHKELVFVSFKKGFNKDISPATISSWIKQTVILCYELSDQDSHTLHQVKAHDIRSFAASKAFQAGVSLEQILSWILLNKKNCSTLPERHPSDYWSTPPKELISAQKTLCILNFTLFQISAGLLLFQL